jgi:hypothetical protein
MVTRIGKLGTTLAVTRNRGSVAGDVMFPVRYELGFYIPEDDILHSHCRENLKSYIAITGWAP